ncbi:protein of unknown function [endosymbiont DhMRE of Dentiscutata heterogama]|uniref:hypothetical protein n=1 Tax=endosymbiont DhMRE of Dentiscutata heterogama TaxID=1609546 RepID=UPI000629DB68|nr:hypothetical protein [endosymbiont DhMRE of Dentiscutata heterogama]CFW92883.1 protein of unknown function [endosymbiont DhMRE of Dentiscutata heterogama]
MAKLQFSYDSIVGGAPSIVYGSEYELTMNVREIDENKQNVDKINRIRIIAHHDDILFFQQYFNTRKKYCFEMDDSDISQTKKELGMFNVVEINFDKTRKHDSYFKPITFQQSTLVIDEIEKKWDFNSRENTLGEWDEYKKELKLKIKTQANFTFTDYQGGKTLVIEGEKAREVWELIKQWKNNQEKKITLQGIIAARAVFKANYSNAYLYLDDNAFDKAILGEEETNETNNNTSSHNNNNDSNSNNNNNLPPTPTEIFQKAWNGKDGNSQLKSLINKYKVMETEFLNVANESYLTSDRQIDLTALEGFFKIAFGDRVVEPEQQEPKQNNTPDNHEQTKTDAIQKINETLNQEPKILSSELGSDYANWEAKINSFSKIDEINNFRDKVLANIRSKRQNKEKESKLNEEIKNAQNKSGEDLEKELEKMEENEGSEAYKKKEEEIKKLNEKLAQENPELYRQKVINVLTRKMEKWEIDESELSVELKEEWNKLKSGENINTTQVDEINQKLTQFVGSTGAEKSLTKLLNQAQVALKSGQKTEIDKAKNDLLDFLKSTNVYEKNVVSARESDIEKMIKDLENYSSQNAGSPSKQDFPWKVVVPIFLLVVLVGAALVVVRNRKARKKNR